MGNDGNGEKNTVQNAVENLESEMEKGLANNCIETSVVKHDQILNIKKSSESSSCRELSVPNVRGFHSSIPKHITTFDEKYALRCLELIRSCALRAAALKFVSKLDALPDDINYQPKIEIPGFYDMTRMASGGCPWAIGTELTIDATGDWTIGTVTYSPSMINILKSPLIRQYGSVDFDLNYGKNSSLEANEPVHSEFAYSSKEKFDVLSQKSKKEVTVTDRKYVYAPMHKRAVSTLSTNSSCSDKSSASSASSVSSFQGMLQCTWNNGLPHLVFTVDDKKEMLLANLSKMSSSDGKVMDYAYTFHSRKKGKKESDLNELDFEIVGKMKVSTSISIGCNNTGNAETRFILSVLSGDHSNEIQISNQNHSKHNRLTRKVVNVFKSSQSIKRRSVSKFEGSNAISEDAPWDPPEVMHQNLNHVETIEEKHNVTHNHELAAIVVKEVFNNQKKEAVSGGWGLKFLNRLGHDNTSKTVHTLYPAPHNMQCSTSLDVLIPAGVHGGPRTRVGGPSSLIERWISGGKCECGGWDMGCPLTVLNSRSCDTDSMYEGDCPDKECTSVNLFIQGSKLDLPVLKMANIREGLYYIHFQSTLSTLQSFAIAASIIHSHSPLLRSKVYRN